jgi:aromatic-amino-acid transaminase
MEDGAVIGKFVAAGLNFLGDPSFSKSFSLYGRRCRRLSLCASKSRQGAAVADETGDSHQLQQPGHHGGTAVAFNTQAARNGRRAG